MAISFESFILWEYASILGDHTVSHCGLCY